MAEVQQTYPPEIIQNFAPPPSLKLFPETVSSTGLFNASIDPKYAHPFGRDGLTAIRDTMELFPEKAEVELLRLAPYKEPKQYKHVNLISTRDEIIASLSTDYRIIVDSFEGRKLAEEHRNNLNS